MLSTPSLATPCQGLTAMKAPVSAPLGRIWCLSHVRRDNHEGITALLMGLVRDTLEKPSKSCS
jgi:hypothetical protein